MVGLAAQGMGWRGQGVWGVALRGVRANFHSPWDPPEGEVRRVEGGQAGLGQAFVV